MKTTRFLIITMLLFIGLANADSITLGNAEEKAVERWITLLALLTPILGLYAVWKFFKFIIKLSTGGSTFTDSRDGKVYKTVKIGKQTWMAENLNYNANDSKCYGNNIDNCDKYGRLYNWYTANRACPKGWHLPKKEEWQALVDFAGGDKIAGLRLKAKKDWNSSHNKKLGNGTDSYGFAALPGGTARCGWDCSRPNFDNDGYCGYWWIDYGDDSLPFGWFTCNETDGFSLSSLSGHLVSARCIKD